MFGRLGAALAAVSALLLVAACSSGGRAYRGAPTYPGLSSLGPSLGLTPGVSAPTGIAGVTGSTSGKARPSKGVSSGAAGRSSGVATAGGHGVRAPGQSTSGGGAPRSSTAHSTTAAPPPPPSGPQVAVSPASGLRGGQRVQVIGTAFAANSPVKIYECHGGSPCTRLVPLDRISTDGGGRVSEPVTVSSRVGIYSCGSSCVISVQPSTGAGASAPISFG